MGMRDRQGNRQGRLLDQVQELAERLELEFGELAGLCLPASTVLASCLREQGVDAQVIRGSYVDPSDRSGRARWPHAYVVVEGIILDPTRGQFDGGPLLTPLSDPWYESRSPEWAGALVPPARPSYNEAREVLNSWWASIGVGAARKAAMLDLLEDFRRP